MLVILLNCVTLGMFHPCEDIVCSSDRCHILEMVIKMLALGIFGKKCYLGDTWNRLDFFIVLAGKQLIQCQSTRRNKMGNTLTSNIQALIQRVRSRPV
ncbi:hypothetical protein F7725_013866 [Dissostichus mawsoni]|uniref:Ion transport domain-containing protein n=1 Tax=Dissostichus mawsoni TaxID=36200 RepID=A0A7J5YYJ7_DISMA|nr:hypothetical protein F7725_013866 [Dissostichus mawsoni]